MRLPTPSEVARVEEELGIRFHPDFRSFLLHASDVVVGTLEPDTIALPGAHTDLKTIALAAREVGVPKDWTPVCESNGDYFCLTPNGEVRFWSHDGVTDESWPSLSTWIDDVWLSS